MITCAMSTGSRRFSQVPRKAGFHAGASFCFSGSLIADKLVAAGLERKGDHRPRSAMRRIEVHARLQVCRHRADDPRAEPGAARGAVGPEAYAVVLDHQRGPALLVATAKADADLTRDPVRIGVFIGVGD